MKKEHYAHVHVPTNISTHTHTEILRIAITILLLTQLKKRCEHKAHKQHLDCRKLWLAEIQCWLALVCCDSILEASVTTHQCHSILGMCTRQRACRNLRQPLTDTTNTYQKQTIAFPSSHAQQWKQLIHSSSNQVLHPTNCNRVTELAF